MAAEIDFELDGVEEAVANLAVYEQDVQERVDHAFDATATEIRDDGKENAPEKTGNLRNSITKEPAPAGTLGYIIFTGIEYAKRQEFGFSGKDSLGREYDQAGFFYLTKAAMSNRDKAIRRVRRALKYR